MPTFRRQKGTEVWRERIEGGYRRISVMQLCMSWSLYVRGRISRADLRVWFACHELEERRCMVERGGKVAFTAEEIGVVTGGLPTRDVRASLRSLESAKLVQARKSRMRFAKTPSELSEEDAVAATAMLSCIVNRRRVIRVPRRLVRELAAGMSKAVTATVYAHLLRCVYFQAAKRRYRTDGRCKASWIAETFAVSERAVVTARRKLVELGWLIVLESSQWELNRFGLRLAVELDWSSRPMKPRSRTACPPRESAGRTACPKANSTLLRKNRTLGTRPSGIGVRKRTKRGRGCWPGPLTVKDLSDPLRLQQVYRKLVGCGVVSASEADQLKVFSMAAHARRGANNPCGLFYVAVRDGLWRHIGQESEELARVQMRVCSDTTGAHLSGERAGGRLERSSVILNTIQELWGGLAERTTALSEGRDDC